VNLKPSIVLVLILLIFASQAEIYPQNRALGRNTFPRLEPDPKALEFAHLGTDDVYSWTALAEISLWASGNLSRSNLEKIKSIAETIKKSPDLPKTDEEAARFILAYMHKNILRSYSHHQTRIDTLLSNGRYNCVSSAVLFMILCKSFGLIADGVITKDHAFVTILIGETVIYIETTNSVHVPARNYNELQIISPIEFVSLILNNRISELERQNRYADAVPLAIDRAALLFGESLTITAESYLPYFLFADPREDLMDRLINYGSALLRANREEDCLRWAENASSKYPHPERWQELIAAAVNNRAVRFIKERKTTEARNFLEKNKILLTETNYTSIDAIITNAERQNR